MKALGSFFKSGIGITILILISAGILAIVGYNFWGWFGGSASWKASHPINSGTGGGTGGATGNTVHRTINNIPSNQEQNFRNNSISKAINDITPSQKVMRWQMKELHCDYKTPVTVNGIQYSFYNIGEAKGYPGNLSSTGYFVIYSNPSKTPPYQYYSISKQDFDNWQSHGCNPAPPAPTADCSPDRIAFYTQQISNANAVLAQGGLSQNQIDNIQSGIKEITKWLDNCKNPNLPHNKWSFISKEEPNKHTAVLWGTSPAPTQLTIGKKIQVDIFPNIYWQAPSQSYSATIIDIKPPMQIITDIPYVGLTNLPQNVAPTMGNGYVTY